LTGAGPRAAEAPAFKWVTRRWATSRRFRSEPIVRSERVPRYAADLAYFDAALEADFATKTTVEKGYGRIETWAYSAPPDPSYLGAPRFSNIKTILQFATRVEYADNCGFETHYFISSPPLQKRHWR